MLRIVTKFSSADAKKYFRESLVHEDSHLGKEHTAGRWSGKGAERLGLADEVRRNDFYSLCDNQLPGGAGRLTPRTKANRRVGYDFNFSCPKGLSLLHSLGHDPHILPAFRESVDLTMHEVESDMHTRVRHGGVSEDRKTGNLVCAGFTHLTARPVDGVGDPQIHDHRFVFNATYDPKEKRWKAAQLRPVKELGPYYEALFLSLLAERVHKLGYETEARGPYWDIKGMPATLIENFSRRTRHIENEAAAKGINNPVEKAALGARTRRSKREGIAGTALEEAWRSRVTDAEWEALTSLRSGRDERRAADIPDELPAGRSGMGGRDEPTPASPSGHGPEEPRRHTARAPGRDAGGAGDRERGPPAPINLKDEGFEPRQGAEPEAPEGKRSPDSPKQSRDEQPSGGRHGRDTLGATIDAEWSTRTATNATAKAPRSRRDVRDLAGHAMGRVFERSAVVPERDLITEALRLGPGRATVEELRAEFDRQGVIVRRDRNGRVQVTTTDVLREEEHMVKLATEGRGRFRPLADKPVKTGAHGLRAEQTRALNHVLRSRDFVTLVEGPAGTGKTRVVGGTRDELNAMRGILGQLLPEKLVVLAPSAEASRGVLRSEGFEKATTVAKFLAETKAMSVGRTAGEQMLGRVVWVDEAGLLGTSSTVQLLERCRSMNARVVLASDPAQQRSVARGDCVSVLKGHAGLPSVRLEEIQRQRGEYKAAVEDLSRGRADRGFTRLTLMGAIKEVPEEKAAALAARDYLDTVNAGKKALLVAPTHVEKDQVTHAVRSQMKEDGALKKERSFPQLKRADGTLEDRSRAGFYARGQVVQFHQNAWGFKAGSRWNVQMVAPFGNVVVTSGSEVKSLPLGKADRFEVYNKSTVNVAVGDVVRITRNGKTFSVTEAVINKTLDLKRSPKHDLNNGTTCRVKRFTKDGGLHLENGLIVPKDYGHIDHGYCLTTRAAQGKTTDRVVVLQTKQSGRAASLEEFYVAVSRGRESVAVYTEDAKALGEAVARSSRGMSAMDLTTTNTNDEHVRRGIDRAKESQRQIEQHTKSEERRDRGFERERT